MGLSPMHRAAVLLFSSVIVSTAFVGTALADTVENSILAHNGTDRIVPGGTLTVSYWIQATNSDKQHGCNAADGTPATLTIAPSSADVTATPSSLTFNACGAPQSVDLTSTVVGNYRINLLVSDAGNDGTYAQNGAEFTLHVAAAEPDAEPTIEPPAPDTTAPTWTTPGDFTAPATDANGAIVTYAASATDETALASSSCAPASGSTFPLGPTTVQCTAIDAAGNSGSTSFTVTVADQTAPTIAPHGDVTVEATGPGGATVTYVAPAWSDNVDAGGTASCVPASGGPFPLGDTLVACDASDAAGNAATAVTFVVRVVDTTAPTLLLPADITLEATGPDGASLDYDASASDAVGVTSFVCAPPDGTFALGDTTVTCDAADAAGNAASGSFHVLVQDTTPPALTLPPDVSLEADALGGAYVIWSASASDIVDGVMTPTCDSVPGSLYVVGKSTIACSATDAAGNTASGSFDITIVDTTPPSIAALMDQTLGATSGAGAYATWTASATDIVDGAVSVICSPASGSLFALGTTTVSCSATDHAGNSASASFTVSVALQCDGPLAPIKQGHTTFKHGSTVPIKCRLFGASVGVSDATIRLTMRHLNSNAPGSAETVSTSAADTGNVMRYDATADQYIYDLGTRTMSKGTWQITMDLGGGQLRTFNLALK